MSRSVRRSACVLLATLATVVVAEAVLRAYRPVRYLASRDLPGPSWSLVHRRSEVPGLLYELVPGAEGVLQGAPVHVNGAGFRDEELLPDDTPGLVRVVALGDSFTFGWGVEAEETYPEVLERLLNDAETGGAVEVVNCGVSGYATRDEAAQLVGRLLDLRPDLVTLGYCLNDPEGEGSQPLARHFSEPRAWERSHLLRLLAKRLHERRVASLGGGDYFRFLHAEGGPRWPSVPEGFRTIARACTERGIPFVLVLFPSPPVESWSEYAYADLHAQVAAAAGAEGFQVLDLLEAFRSLEPGALRLSAKDAHPTALGHSVAARELEPVVRGLLSDEGDLDESE